MIKGLGEQKASVRYNICTNFMDVVLLYLLLPHYGIVGYFISFTVTHVINFYLSLRRLLRITGIDIKISVPVRCIFAGCLAVWIAGFASAGFQVIAGVVLLFSLLFLLGVVQKADVQWMVGLIKKDRPG
jgi:O-antigen/teichoic acid export membrane protein